MATDIRPALDELRDELLPLLDKAQARLLELQYTLSESGETDLDPDRPARVIAGENPRGDIPEGWAYDDTLAARQERMRLDVLEERLLAAADLSRDLFRELSAL
jgi:hypothetical protein